MLRTIWRRNASPTTSIVTSRPCLRTRTSMEGPDRLPMLPAECGEVVPPDKTVCGRAASPRRRAAPDAQGVPLAQAGCAARSRWCSGTPAASLRGAGRKPGGHPAQRPDRDIRRQERPDGADRARSPASPPGPGECDHLSAWHGPRRPSCPPRRPGSRPPPRCAPARAPALPGRSGLQAAPGSRRTRCRRIRPVRCTARGRPLGRLLCAGPSAGVRSRRARAGRWGPRRRPAGRA